MFLFIDTTSVEDIFVALIDGQGDFLVKKKVRAKYKQSEKLLREIEKLSAFAKATVGQGKLGNSGIRKFKLNGIIVVKGPGSFTSLRIGVATANALAFGMGLPVVGVKKQQDNKSIKQENKKAFAVDQGGGESGKLAKDGLKLLKKAKLGKWVTPEYGREPNITMKKK